MLNNARGWKVVILIFFFQFSNVPPKVVMKQKKVWPKFVYKTNKEGENLGILLHVGEPLGPIS
jgi:hypothetical protein